MYCMASSSLSITPLRRTGPLDLDSAEVDDRERVCSERRCDHAYAEVAQPAREELREPIQQVVEARLQERRDDEDDQQRPEYGPAVPAHECVRAAERGTHPALLDDDHRHDHAPAHEHD